MNKSKLSLKEQKRLHFVRLTSQSASADKGLNRIIRNITEKSEVSQILPA